MALRRKPSAIRKYLVVVCCVVYFRWDETHVVAMDIDISDQIQQQMVLQVRLHVCMNEHTYILILSIDSLH